ncbi:MAG: T9SS type A sorting domain-containing protein [Bacteroidia bacterium]|nr:T9SS type A sorting domain-containing protein [Bacteroidia bacterium]
MKRSIQSVLFWCLVFVLAGTAGASAQSFMAQAQSNGFTLKKVVSDTAIATGQNFSYTVYFSIPAGATNVTITDVLPSSVTFQSFSVTSACGTPTVVTPPVGSSGTVSLSWASVPSGCSGSFVVTVQFPNGVTCPGTTARNNVCLTAMLSGVPVDFCTGFVSTTALASNPWNIGKWVVGAGTQPGPCPYVTADSLITYQICVYKNVGLTGQLNMFNAVVYDTLPAGAYLVSSSCGATQVGNVITWNIGALSALPMYTMVCCTYTIAYPPATFPTGTQVTNKATLQGTLGSANNPCGPANHTSQQTCVEIKSVTSGTLAKYVYTNGQPGCTGKYMIWVCNNGSTTISSMTITDTIPAALTGISLGTVSTGLTAVLTGNVVTVTLSSPLPPTQCRYFEVNFTIPSTATVGSTITNCAHATIVGVPPLTACATFTVSAPAPTPCLWKEVCSKQPSYTPGSIFRYRLRVQNIGGLPITGATITDVLNPNLQYVGNPSYYTGTAWNTPCTPTSNWTGVSVAQAGNTLTFTLPSIAATCQNIFYGACGMYGAFGVPYYFIEFDVKVADTSALGNIPNNFTISGGNLTGTTTSNTDLVTVVGTTGFLLEKAVAKDTTSWASTVNTLAGSNVNYRLRLTVAPGSVGLRHVTFADLLPRDNAPNDNLILGPCSPRGSAFDIGFASPISTSPLATGYRNATAGFANVNIFAPAGAPAAMFTSGCGTTGSWAPGILAADRNLGWYFGSAPIPAGNSATSLFTATVPASAQDQTTSCNTFAANGAVRHLINSTVISDQVIGNLESGTACVTVVKDTTSKEGCFKAVLNGVLNTGVDSAGNCTYDVIVTFTNTGAPTMGYFESFSGVVNPSPLLIPTGTTVDTLSFTDTPPTDIFVCIRYGVLDPTGAPQLCDSLCLDLPPCASGDPCDSLRAQFKSINATGVDAVGNCTYSVDIDFTNTSSGPIAVWFDSFQGSVVPAGANLPVGVSTQTFTFTDIPPTDVLACIRYGITLGQQPPVRVVCDSVCFDLPPCDDTGDPCDSLRAQVKQVSSTGTNSSGNCTYSVDITFTNSASSTATVWFESFQGAVAPATLNIPVGSSTQTVTFTDTPPTDALVCIRYGYFQGPQPVKRILCDSICFDITPCSDLPCDSLVKAELDTLCCDYKATIVNASSTPITSISYYITGGTLNSFTTMPCMPVSPPAVGSTSGILLYSPACNSNINFMFQAVPNTPSNTVSVTLVIHHDKDSCVVRFQYTCDRTPLQRCDDLKVKPFISSPLSLSGRSFTITNNKVPASPITHVTITPVPTPCTFIGGGLQVDYTATPWAGPYTRIPATGFISANAAVSFNLAINYSCNWTGNVQIVVHHADGDSCIYTYGPWKAQLGIGTGVVISDPIKDRVYANRLRMQNPGSGSPVKWLSINVEAPTDVIIAGSGKHWDGATLRGGYEMLEGYEQGATEVLFTFDTPIATGRTSEYFNLVVARDSAASGIPVVRWTTYDEEGNALATDTVSITTTVLSVRGGGASSFPSDFELLHSFPNPAMHSVTVNYAMAAPMDIRLELYNQLGERVSTVWQGHQSSGLHAARFDVSALAAGTYIVRLSSAGGFVTRPLIITR